MIIIIRKGVLPGHLLKYIMTQQDKYHFKIQLFDLILYSKIIITLNMINKTIITWIDFPKNNIRVQKDFYKL